MLGKGVNELGDTIGFNIILIVSLIMIIFLFFINRSKNISYDYIKVQRGEANE
ncbi:hypothetical protein O270_02811 [Staphylococcus aureus M0070]|nr:hypothetical protein O270_02811 [Staphylococcus aureus M0070]